MKKNLFIQAAAFAVLIAAASCNQSTENENKSETKSEAMKPLITESNVSYKADTMTMQGFVAYDSSIAGKRPVVLVVPEWWGLNDYTRSRARQLASLGYLAMAVDMYGEGRIAENPDMAGKMAMPFYKDAALAKSHFDAALASIKANPLADTSKVAAIGYCFGGGMVLNMARLGENLSGVVSFHGSLVGVPADKKLLKAPILVCHGDSDKFVKPDEVAKFKFQLDSIGASYTFKTYANATHAFTNPDATATGKKFSMPIEYNAAADTASWNDMKDFFGKIFK